MFIYIYVNTADEFRGETTKKILINLKNEKKYPELFIIDSFIFFLYFYSRK